MSQLEINNLFNTPSNNKIIVITNTIKNIFISEFNTVAEATQYMQAKRELLLNVNFEIL